MNKQLLAAAVLAVIGTSAFAQADPTKGGSSSGDVLVGLSTFPSIPIIAPDGYAALQMKRNDGTYSGFIPLRAPVNLVTAVTLLTPNLPGPYYVNNPLTLTQIAQVWRTNTSYNAVAETYSLRQTDYPTATGWPHFGGLVVGRVVGTGASNGVYFGEWSPAKAGGPGSSPSANLNMDSPDRTVWYVGDNAVTATNMPSAINATYNVVGISQTGTDANGTLPGGLPHNPNLYTGNLTVTYNGVPATSSIAGSLTRSGSSPVNFTGSGTIVNTNGTFGNGSNIQGRFYNGANALAGIYTGATGAADDVAFGGSRVSGTITP